jgi:hypothetical protein
MFALRRQFLCLVYTSIAQEIQGRLLVCDAQFEFIGSQNVRGWYLE